ncbi:MAG: hypothetical protein JWQ22_2749 [Devosia sp.]|nr:hypothetical protein [Devosia sp.]
MRDVGAGQFDGLQEGEPHWRLKNCLADSIRCDSDCSEPVVDKHFIKIGKGHRKPDVFTAYNPPQSCQADIDPFRLELASFQVPEGRHREGTIRLRLSLA